MLVVELGFDSAATEAVFGWIVVAFGWTVAVVEGFVWR